jgi:hypothetical protein
VTVTKSETRKQTPSMTPSQRSGSFNKKKSSIQIEIKLSTKSLSVAVPASKAESRPGNAIFTAYQPQIAQ